jgi:Holliday junction resolvase
VTISNVHQGTRAEKRSIAVLEADGYAVTRSAGSRGVWDLIGVRRSDVVLVQVKTRRWPKSVELRRMRAFECPKGVRRLIHRWRRGVAEPDVRAL